MLSNMGKYEKLFLHKVFYRKKQCKKHIYPPGESRTKCERERERETSSMGLYNYKKSMDYILAFYQNS